jgi:hypothetical protein
VIEEGRALLSKGIVSHALYSLLIQTLVELKKRDEAKELLASAIGHFPDDKGHFTALLTSA